LARIVVATRALEVMRSYLGEFLAMML